MEKRRSSKEKKEVGLILGAVFLVAVVGVSLHFFQEHKLEALAGAAVRINPDLPTYGGTLVLLREHCQPLSGSGACDAICTANKTCIPINQECSKSVNNNQCLCCDNFNSTLS